MPAALPVLDPTQLRRIEAVHRGFLYQHLYAASCLMLAAGASASAVLVEADEDIEIVLPDRRLYVQVKTRSEPLAQGDIGGAIERFAQLRQEHVAGKRPGAAVFVIVANAEPGPRLAECVKGAAWPKDTNLYWPGNDPADRALPAAWRDVGEGLRASGVPRDQVFVTTKLWNEDQGYDQALRAFDDSPFVPDIESAETLVQPKRALLETAADIALLGERPVAVFGVVSGQR